VVEELKDGPMLPMHGSMHDAKPVVASCMATHLGTQKLYKQ